MLAKEKEQLLTMLTYFAQESYERVVQWDYSVILKSRQIQEEENLNRHLITPKILFQIFHSIDTSLLRTV